MQIKKILWMDKDAREAVVLVSNGKTIIRCFSHPCNHQENDILNEPLECLDVCDMQITDQMIAAIDESSDSFSYTLICRIADKNNGIVNLDDFILHIDEALIPNDILEDTVVMFKTSRIDIW